MAEEDVKAYDDSRLNDEIATTKIKYARAGMGNAEAKHGQRLDQLLSEKNQRFHDRRGEGRRQQ